VCCSEDDSCSARTNDFYIRQLKFHDVSNYNKVEKKSEEYSWNGAALQCAPSLPNGSVARNERNTINNKHSIFVQKKMIRSIVPPCIPDEFGLEKNSV
jgi:hypothetical protein